MTHTWNSADLGTLMRDALIELSPNIQDLLFQTKKEQTFSALLAGKVQIKLNNSGSKCLVELKGVDKTNKSRISQKYRNTHDVCIIDADARFEMILENKVWYHFDGAKGLRTKIINPNIEKQLVPDLEKIRHTSSAFNNRSAGFVMICLVTPSEFSQLPNSYARDLRNALQRTDGNMDVLRQEGISGVLSVLHKYQGLIGPISYVSSTNSLGVNRSGILDVIAAEVLVKQNDAS